MSSYFFKPPDSSDLSAGIVKGISRLTVSVAGQNVERSLQYHHKQLLGLLASKESCLPHVAAAFQAMALNYKDTASIR